MRRFILTCGCRRGLVWGRHAGPRWALLAEVDYRAKSAAGGENPPSVLQGHSRGPIVEAKSAGALLCFWVTGKPVAEDDRVTKTLEGSPCAPTFGRGSGSWGSIRLISQISPVGSNLLSIVPPN